MRYLSFDIGYKNMGVCMLDIGDRDKCPDLLYWSCDTLRVKSRYPTIADLVEAASEYVRSNEWIYCLPDVVVIEQQVRKNPKMQHIATALHATIVTLAAAVGHTDLKVVYVPARLKFQRFARFCNSSPNTYRNRKRNAVLITRGILEQWRSHESWAEDVVSSLNFDMADAFTNLCAYARV